MSKHLYENLPDSPGVYLMRDAAGAILYVGKAGNLKRRVSSYFTRPHDRRIERMVGRIAKIDHQRTDTAIEALILEAELIKKYGPPWNVREKDDKSFLYVGITKEKFPRVVMLRGKELSAPADKRFSSLYGPFTSATSLREAGKIIRRIFPFNTHPPEKISASARPCFDAQIGLCPGTCVNAVSREEYMRTVRNIKLFFAGKKAKILKLLEKEMRSAAKNLEYEKAERARRQIFALQHIQDVAFIKDNAIAEPLPEGASEEKLPRIEGYDISNISGTSAVGAMVVFKGGEPDKSQYRKFKIRTVSGSNDVGMLAEVLRRRLRHLGEEGSWPAPDVILIDGGIAQVNAARKVLSELDLKIPILGIAKGPARKRNDVIGRIPPGVSQLTLERVRDEAHRFAISYHKNVRGKEFLR